MYTPKKDTINTRRATSKSIKIKRKIGNLFVKKSGLSAGEIMITKGLGKLKDGIAIDPKETNFDRLVKPVQKEF